MATAEADVLFGVDAWSDCDADLLASWITNDADYTNNVNYTNDSNDANKSGASPPTTKFPPHPLDRNPTRRRQRHELAYLHTRVAELERELLALRTEKGQHDDALVVAAATSTSDVASEWQRIAMRQRRARDRSESENRKLRAMLQSQIKLARTLERLLRKRDLVETQQYVQPKRRRGSDSLAEPIAETERDVFQRLLDGIDRAYSETTAALSANGLLAASPGYRRVGIKQTTPRSNAHGDDAAASRPQELYVELTDVASMPFAVDACASAAWRCITDGYMQLDHRIYDGLAGQDDVLAITYAVSLARRRLCVDFKARAAMKRFVETERIVDVWESISDTASDHDVSTHGIRVRERGWTVFTCHPEDPARTVVLTCMQMVPMVSYASASSSSSSSSASEARQVGVLTTLALDYYGDQLEQAQHAMETMLLDEARSLTAIEELLPRA